MKTYCTHEQETLKMPCIYDDFGESRRQEREELNKVTRLLCEACRVLQNTNHTVSTELAMWWREHQVKDQKRQEDERQYQMKETMRQQAIC